MFASDEQSTSTVDLPRWLRLARLVLAEERAPADAEVSLIFVDEAGHHRPQRAVPRRRRPHRRARVPDRRRPRPERPPARRRRPRPRHVDRAGRPAGRARRRRGVPDGRRSARRPTHAGTLDDELALLVVHGVLHLLNYDHADDRRGGVDATPGTGAAGTFRTSSRAEGRPRMSGADWAILAVVVVLFVFVDLPRRCRRPRSTRMSRIRAIALAGGGRQARRAAWRGCSSTRSRRSTSVLLARAGLRSSPSATLIGVLLEGTAGALRRRDRHRAADRPVLRDRRGRAEDLRHPAHRPRRARASRRCCGSSPTSRRCGGSSNAASSASPTWSSRARA